MVFLLKKNYFQLGKAFGISRQGKNVARTNWLMLVLFFVFLIETNTSNHDF